MAAGLCALLAGCSLLISSDSGGSEADSGVADASADAGRDSGTVRDCRRQTGVEDDFDGVEIDPVWEQQPNASGTLEQQGGRLVITPEPISSGTVQLVSPVVDLTEGQVTASVSEVLSGDSAFSQLAVRGGPGQEIVFEKKGSVLELRSPAGFNSVNYDQSLHRYWRIRTSAGQVIFEFSVDGVRFNHLATQLSLPFDLSAVTVHLGASAAGNDGPGSFRVDDVEISGQPVDGWCEAAALRDQFADGLLAPLWSSFAQANAFVKEENEVARLVPAPAQSTSGLVSVDRYRLTGSAVAVELDATSLDPEVVIILSLRHSSEDLLEIRRTVAKDLRLSQFEAGEATDQLGALDAWDPVAKPWWRIQVDSEGIDFQIGPDGDSWDTLFRAMPREFVTDSVEVLLFIETGGVSNPGELRVLSVGAF